MVEERGKFHGRDDQDGFSDALQTDLGDCANAFLDIARNSSMTGQKIQVGTFLTRAIL